MKVSIFGGDSIKKAVIFTAVAITGTAGGLFLYTETQDQQSSREAGSEPDVNEASALSEETENENTDENESRNENENSNENNNGNEDESSNNEEDRVFFMDDSYFNVSMSNNDSAIEYQEGTEEEAQSLIESLHDTYNETAGYGRAETMDFETFEENEYEDIIEDIDYLKEYLLADSRVRVDVEFLYQMHKFSLHFEESMALRYAHRIIHDLDIYINEDGETSGKRIWGVTQAFGSEEDIQQMHRYIENH